MSEEKLKIDHTPITLENFFAGADYYKKFNQTGPSKEPAPSLADINAVEAKLKVKFPEKLIQLYQRQDGGRVNHLIAPKVENPEEKSSDWFKPFSGYDELLKLEQITTIYDNVEDWADFDEDPGAFPINSERMIMLAQWHRETLFLDYRNGDAPRVGFANFDRFPNLQNDDWEPEANWWNDFDHFFSQLLRGEYS